MLEVQIKDNKIFSPIRNKELVKTPEELVRQNYVCRLVNHYGYALDQLWEEEKVNNSQRWQGKARADLLIFRSKEDKEKNKSPLIVIECKAENIKIQEADYYQWMNYAARAGADFFVTTNEKETKVFRVIKWEIPKRLDEIIDIPFAKDIFDEKKIQKLLTESKVFTRDEFSKLLKNCHDIIRNNDKLSPEAAFDEISKILFMKIRYERQKPTEHTIFSLDRFETLEWAHKEMWNSESFMQYLFNLTKEKFKDEDLFDPNETIKISETSFKQIVKKLEKYNLSDTSDDIKGIAFEQFLGGTFRGELGQFFTPRTIVDYMTLILDPQEWEKICDPCCGSWGFLIKSFEYIREQIENDIQYEKQKIKDMYFDEHYWKMKEWEQEKVNAIVDKLFDQLNEEADKRIKHLSQNCIYGTDANPRMARTAKMNMIMHWDGHSGVHHHDGLLNVQQIKDEMFDCILTNPPFWARVDRWQKIPELDRAYYPNNVGDSILDIYDLGSSSGLTEVLFMERNLKLLKPWGRMAVVLPEWVLNSSNLQKVRDYFMGRAKILFITSIPQDVFVASGATVKCSLVFLKRLTTHEEQVYLDTQTKTYNKLGLTVKEISYMNRINRQDSVDRSQYKLIINLEQQYNQKLEEAKKAKNTELAKELKKQFNDEIKIIKSDLQWQFFEYLKAQLNYQVAIVEVEKAGISTTGGVIDNDLEQVIPEFKKRKEEANLWTIWWYKPNYSILENQLIVHGK